MKSIKFLSVVLLTFILSSCEGPIYHTFILKNSTGKSLNLSYSLKTNPDSITNFTLLTDSTKIIAQTDEMQGFFTDKVMPVKISEVFDFFDNVNDSSFNDISFMNDSLWNVEYIPGEYRYTFIVK